MPAIKKTFPAWNDFDQPGYDISGKGTQLLDAVRWLKRPALLRYVVAHSDPWGSTFAKTADVQVLERACGGTPWNWARKGGKLVPSLSTTPHKLDFAIHRTLWKNQVLPDRASMYVRGGCNAISPAAAAKHRYNHPQYGHWQGAESFLFHCNGVVLMGRSKVFYDRPRGLLKTLAHGGSVSLRGQFPPRYFGTRNGLCSLMANCPSPKRGGTSSRTRPDHVGVLLLTICPRARLHARLWLADRYFERPDRGVTNLPLARATPAIQTRPSGKDRRKNNSSLCSTGGTFLSERRTPFPLEKRRIASGASVPDDAGAR